MGIVEVLASSPAGRSHAPACRRLLLALIRATRRTGAGVTLLLTTDTEIRRLNRSFRKLDRTTDVLCFPFDGELEPRHTHLGDIAVSMTRAASQARRAGWPLTSEMALLVTHGYLHLLGYDHETDDGTMRRREVALLRSIAKIDPGDRGLVWGEHTGGGGKSGVRRRVRRSAATGHGRKR